MVASMTAARRWRLGAVIAVAVAVVVLAKTTGLTGWLEKDRLRALVLSAGACGPLVFLALFCAGELVHVPGTVFVAASVFAYGRTMGGLLAYAGAIASFSLVFAVVRSIGGTPLGEIRWERARRILAHLEERPVRTVILLRLLLWMSPTLNYVLALSRVRFSRYFVGSVLGLALPIFVLAVLSDRLLR